MTNINFLDIISAILYFLKYALPPPPYPVGNNQIFSSEPPVSPTDKCNILSHQLSRANMNTLSRKKKSRELIKMITKGKLLECQSDSKGWWNSGTIVECHSHSNGWWNSGTIVECHSDSKGRWNSGTIVQCHSDSKGCGNNGTIIVSQS